METKLKLPLFGKLTNVIINELAFRNSHDGFRKFGTTQVKLDTNYSMIVKEDTFDEYMITVELHVLGTEKESSDEVFFSSGKMTGHYKCKESFKEYQEGLFDILRTRGMYQIYSMVRMEVQSMLRRAGIMVRDFEFEQDEVINAAIESSSVFVEEKGVRKKTIAKKKAVKKKTTKVKKVSDKLE